MSEFLGLDIGTTAVRLVELHGSGKVKALGRYAFIPIDPKIALSDSKADHQKLAQAIQELLTEARITTRNVAVGLPSSRVFTTVIDIERLKEDEIEKTINYQADSIIPTPVAESKIDWSVLGDSPTDKTKVEVLITSITNDYLESRLDMLESIGLNVIAFEPESIALTRAVLAPENAAPQLVLHIDDKGTNLIVSMNGAPRLVRAIPTGSEAIIKAVVQNLSIDENQARQFVFKFGLAKDKLEGQIYNSIIGTIDTLMLEIEKSIKFFQTRYVSSKIERVVVTGSASVLPEFPLYIANKFGLNVEIGNAWRNVAYPADRQNELLAASNHFCVAAGLAERQA